MSIDPVNIGSTPNDGSGHDLRSGGAIINANFAQLDARTAAAQAKADAAVPGSELGARVRSTTLAGLGSLVNAAIVATDTVLQAFAKLQAQINQSIKKGEFGLGGDTGAEAADCNLITRGGYYKVTAETLNQPGQGGCSLAHVSHSPGFWTQLAFGQGPGAAMWLRSKSGGDPGSWGRVLKTGDYGIGAAVSTYAPGNDITKNPVGGLYLWDPQTTGRPNNSDHGVALSAVGWSDKWGCKLIMSASSNSLWYKRHSDGVDQPAVKVLLQGDYGVGAVRLDSCENANEVAASGKLLSHPGTANSPGVYGVIDTAFYEKSSVNFTQMIHSITGQGIFYRNSVNGAISPWGTIATSREGYSGTMARSPAGTNANALPPYSHRLWIDSNSSGGPSIADWLIDHTFIQTGYAWQTARALNPDVPGVYTRVQNAGNWSNWAPPTEATERIANSNGQALKFPDGTMICWTARKRTVVTTIPVGSLFLNEPGNSFSWPVPFAGDRPSITISVDNPAVSLGWGAANTPATLSGIADVRFLSTVIGASADIACVAIGRWK